MRQEIDHPSRFDPRARRSPGFRPSFRRYAPVSLPARVDRLTTNDRMISNGRCQSAHRRAGRRTRLDCSSRRSPGSGSPFGIFANAAVKRARLPRLPRAAKYSSVNSAAIFSATAELTSWLMDTPSFSATSPNRRWRDVGSRRLNALIACLRSPSGTLGGCPPPPPSGEVTVARRLLIVPGAEPLRRKTHEAPRVG